MKVMKYVLIIGRYAFFNVLLIILSIRERRENIPLEFGYIQEASTAAI